MLITSTPTPQLPGARKLNGPDGQPPQPPEMEAKPELENVLDRYNASRVTGNYVSAMSLGAAKETVATIAQSPRLAWEIAENLWQAETIGPNLKVLGTLAAVPLAALSIPVGPFYGAVEGASMVAHARRAGRNLVRQDTAPEFARATFAPQLEEDGARTMTGKLVNSLEELGSKKLAEGEKPYDVPLLSPFFSVTGGVVSAVVSGVVGLVAGVAAGTITTAKEMAGAFTAKDKTAGERIGQFCAAPLNMLVMGPALAWSSVKEATPRGFVDGWKHGPIKPVVDTAKISGQLAASTLKEAWNR